jgi:hypothetical protein
MSKQIITPAMEELIKLSRLIGISKSIEDAIQTVAEKGEVVVDAMEDAISHGKETGDWINAMVLIDMAKSLATRDLAFRRRWGAEYNGSAMFAQSNERHIHDYLENSPGCAIWHFYLNKRGELWLLVAQNHGGSQGICIGGFQFWSADAGATFLSLLDEYAVRPIGQQPNNNVLSEILKLLGRYLIPMLMQIGLPKKIVLIPHRKMHLLPLHAIFIDAGSQRIYLDSLVPEISYSSCITELFLGHLNQSREMAHPSPRILAILDTKDSSLPWLHIEEKNFEVLSCFGCPVDIISNQQELPGDLSPYGQLHLSCHGSSDPFNWGGSWVSFDGFELKAKDIATKWRLQQNPVVTLTACETGMNPEALEVLTLVDEYCGLDRAFYIAGAGRVIGSLWSVHDSLCTIVGTVLPSCIGRAISERRPISTVLSELWRGFRNGTWKSFFPNVQFIKRLEKINLIAAGKLQEVLASIMDIEEDAFKEFCDWSTFRCYGG